MPANQMSNYFAQAILDFYFGKNNTTLSVPTTWWVCMYTTDPGIADAGVEVSGGGYIRLGITNSPSFFSPASNRAKTCSGGSFPLAWFTATGSFGPIVATGLRDAQTAGNLVLVNSIPLGSQQSIAVGNNITFNAADFSFRID